jgi:CheY-like chemotaxis protein
MQEKEKNYAKNLESEIAKQTAEIRKTNQELVEASRLKSEFLANMSHELRTPMNAIIGFSELLADTELSPVQTEYALTIKQSGSGLLSLINDILDFSKIEADKLDIEQYPFKLSEVLTNICAMFDAKAAEKGINLHFYLDEQLRGEFVGDGNRLKQVLVNLTGNALKFTENGEVEVRADLGGREGDKAVVHYLVRDTGLGIAKERQTAVFEKFVQEDGTTTRKFGGTGLGLAISSRLVSLMGGHLTVESELGKGSIFRFSLIFPYMEARAGKISLPDKESRLQVAASKAPLAAGALETERLEAKTVLLVEDNLVNQKLASVLIQKQGLQVVVAADGLVALEKLKERRFDLILMDLQMPKMGGLEATRRIREIEQSSESGQYKGLRDQDHPVPIVGLSAHARKEDAEEGLAIGMNDFLTKPIVRAKLEAVLALIEHA